VTSPARTRPKVVAISNENPEWPAADKVYADEMWQLLLDGLDEEGFTYRSFKFFDDLACLDAFDPREWLVWNWGEEWGGAPWSDAAVAEEIERRGFAYTGATPDVMRLAQNRMAIKEHLRSAGLPTLPARVFADSADAAAWASFPAIVKGANQHASVGIDRESVVASHAELAARIAYMRECHGDDSLVEPFLDSREIQVAVWGNAHPEALPASEIVFTPFADMRDRLHTRQWKIERESRGYREIEMPCPAPADRPDWRARAEEIAVAAYRAVGLRDYARFDLRMLGDEPQILDVNPNPELDPLSVVLAGAKAKGMTYGQMAGRIIEYAAERMPTSRV
jgi:D-alanine-D-alanine ligase